MPHPCETFTLPSLRTTVLISRFNRKKNKSSHRVIKTITSLL